MGGYGSGRWQWHNKRLTAEASKRLYITQFTAGLRQLERGESGALWYRPSWACGDRPSGNISLTLAKWGRESLRAQVSYTQTDYAGNKTEFDYSLEIAFTLTPWGSRRYWWLCPTCGRRAGALYLPPGGRRFACRQCHNLTYQASQEAHKYDNLYSRLAADLPGYSGRDVKDMLEDDDLFTLLEAARTGKLSKLSKKTRRRLAAFMNTPEQVAARQERTRAFLAQLEAEQAARYADYLSAGQLAERAGLTPGELAQLSEARLLVPDRGDLYRPKLAGWACKLAELLHAGWDVASIKSWARGRWSTPNPRQWPPILADWQALQ